MDTGGEPPGGPPKRINYFLTRDQIAQRIRVARRRPETRHLVRFILVGLYTGSRPGVVLGLRWVPAVSGGHVDVDAGIIHRKTFTDPENRKRAPIVRIHDKLLRHLRAWRAHDMALGITHVVHFAGRSIQNVSCVWETVRRRAGHEHKDAPHILRHTAATPFMASGLDVALIGGFLGVTPETLWTDYGHHHPALQKDIARTAPGKHLTQAVTEAYRAPRKAREIQKRASPQIARPASSVVG